MTNLSHVPKKTQNFRKYFKEYCNSSSFHGIRYIGEGRTYFERGWWCIVFLMCLSCCAYFITTVYQKWENSPVIVSFGTREKPIYEIPFPAVTICPESKAIQERYSYSGSVKQLIKKNVNKEVTGLTIDQYKQMSYMDLLCDANITEELSDIYKTDPTINATFDNYYYSDNDFFDFMFNVTPNIFDNFLKCRWMDLDYSCDELFDLIITDEGVCATFNMLDNSKIYNDFVYFQDIPFGRPKKSRRNVTWTLDTDYLKHEDIDTYPRRALYSGAKNALYVRLKEPHENLDHTCKLSLQGFKVSLHIPLRIPRPSQQYFRLPLNKVVMSAVQPVMITTSHTVKLFKTEKRECFFLNEKPLKFFKMYTQRNCQLECLTNFTMDWCWCVNFFMPRDNDTVICGSLSKPCMEDAEKVLQKGRLNNLLGVKKKKNSTDDVEIPDCNCLPLCTDLSYDVETTTSDWDWKNILTTLHPNDTEAKDQASRMSMSNLIIYFKNNQFVTSRRHELYGPTDFIANFGGLLGLFTGFSILSLMEIIYFLTVRIICNIRLYGNWSGEKHVEKKM